MKQRWVSLCLFFRTSARRRGPLRYECWVLLSAGRLTHSAVYLLANKKDRLSTVTLCQPAAEKANQTPATVGISEWENKKKERKFWILRDPLSSIWNQSFETERDRKPKHERGRDGQHIHEGALIRVMDTPIKHTTHPSSLSSFIPFIFEVLGSQFQFFIHLFFLTHKGPLVDSLTSFFQSEREL